MENLSMLFQRNRGLPVALTLGALAALLFAVTWSGCGQVECGKGTVEVDGVCQAANVLECAAGFKALGEKCVPQDEWVKLYCGQNSEFDEATGKCKGTGGGTITPTTCKVTCPPVSGSQICLQGQVFRAGPLIAHWADDPNWTIQNLQDATKGALITTKQDKAIIKVYDPIDFVSNPAGAQPLGEVNIDDDGCFVAENITVPFAGFLALTVEDQLATGTDWAFSGFGETPIPGKNSINLLVPGVSEKTAADWGHSFLSDGTMLAVFKHKLTGKTVEGVVPTFDGKKPEGSAGSWKFGGTAMDVFYMADDPTNATAIVDDAATQTTKSGIVFIRKAEVKAFSGEKAGCTIENDLGGSTADVLFFRVYDVEGC